MTHSLPRKQIVPKMARITNRTTNMTPKRIITMLEIQSVFVKDGCYPSQDR